MMFSSIESKVGTNFQPSVLSYAKLLHKTQLKACDRNSKKKFISPFPILIVNTEKKRPT